MNSMQELAKKVRLFPEKKSLNGAMMDGPMLAELADKLIETMNSNTWANFGDVYLSMEKYFCDRRYEEIVKPYIGVDSVSLKQFLVSGFKEFEKKCPLGEYVEAAKAEVIKHAERKAELEATQQQLKEQVQRRKIEEERRETAGEEFKKEIYKMKEEVRQAQEARAMAEEREAAMKMRASENEKRSWSSKNRLNQMSIFTAH